MSYVSIHEHAFLYMCTCVGTRDQCQGSSIACYFMYLILEQGLSGNPDITILASLAGQQAPEDLPDPKHLPPNRDWGYGHVLACSALTGSRA